MRIETLRLQAFGPYVEEQVIDFTRLPSHLFLIRGETGAGKTAILDAITYALYGYSSGGERGDFEMMRSRLATVETTTFVECIFCIQQHRYRFFRQIQVHKKRDEQQVYKIKIDAGELLEDGFHPFFEHSKQRLIEEKAQQLIGLSYAQFIQVMMLPQGKFEQLLISSSEAKQAILKSLFQVEKWSAICERLSEKSKLDKEALEHMRVQIQLLLKQSKVASIDDFAPVLQDLQAQYERLCINAKVIQQRYQEAINQLQLQTQFHQLQQRYETCKKEWQNLQLQKKDMENLTVQVQNYQQYMHVKPYYDAMIQSEQRRSERELTIQHIKEQERTLYLEQQSLIQEAQRLESIEQELAVMKEAYPKLLEEYEQFTQRVQLQQAYQEAFQQRQEALEQRAQIQMQLDTTKQQILSLSDDKKRLEGSLQAYPEFIKQEQTYTNAFHIHRQLLAYQAEIIQHKDTLQKQEQQYSTSKEILQTRKQEHELKYQHFLDHSADLLAQSLVEGHPCPVCGATHHPACTHIEVEVDVLTTLRTCKLALEQASEETQKIHEHIQMEGSQIKALRQQMISLEEQLSTLLPNGYDEAKHNQLQKACKQGEVLTLQRVETLQNMEERTTHLQVLEGKQKQLQDTIYGYQQTCAVLQAKLDERKQQYTFQDIAQLQAYIQEQKIKIASYERQLMSNSQKTQENTQAYAIVTSNLVIAENEYEQEQISYASAKTSYEALHIDFPYDTSWESFDRTKATDQLKQYEQRWVEVNSTLQELTSQLEDVELKDMKIMQKQVEEAQTQYQESTKEIAHFEREIQLLQTNAQAVVTLQKKWELALGTYEQLNNFVKSMRGDNRIGIERYVLGVMLSQITQVANQLLQNVHDGRYQIYRSDETSGRVRKFGLELSIYDTYSCSQRSVVSLSGGEKFLVSLALSLALSTVVQARSGGIYLETMFIDEGFGSLDEQSIADALQVLSAMGKSKAMIGIISHVELLKENIPYGIQVYKQREGSTLAMLY